MKVKKLSCLALAAFTGAAIIGCGGGGGGSGSSNNSESSTINGKALDDYLIGAKVCLDKNFNGKCDEGEPSTYTGENGTFSLSVNPSDKGKYPLVVEVYANTQGNVAGGNYTLITPPGKYQVVSPLTSLVFSEMKRNPGISAETAEQILKQRLGTKVSLFTDYLSKSSGEYKEIAKVAQETAKLVTEILDKIKELGITLSDEQYDALYAVIYGIVADHIDEIKYKDTKSILGEIPLDKDTIINSIETLSNLENAKPITNIWAFVNNATVYALSLTDGMYPSQRIVKYREYKIKLKNITDVDDFNNSSKIYDTDKVFKGFLKDSNGNVFLKYGIYKWKIDSVSEVDLNGKTVDVCSLLIADYDREEALKHAKDLCRNVTFQSGDKAYITTMELIPIDMNDNSTLIKIGQSLGPDNFVIIGTASSLEDYIRKYEYPNDNPDSSFSLTGKYEMQFKPSDSNLLKGDVVIKKSGADIGDYWTLSDGNNTYLVIDTIAAGAIVKGPDENGYIYFQTLETKPTIQTSVFLNKSAMNRVISTIRPKIKPLPDSATYPNVGFQYFVNNNTFSEDLVRVMGWKEKEYSNGTLIPITDNCTANYSNQVFNLDNCQNSTINLSNVEVLPYNYGYNTAFIDPDSSYGFLVSYRLTYLDSDTMCLGKGFFNFVGGEFCITKENTPSAQEISELFQKGNSFAYYEFDDMWSLKYCITVNGNSNGALQFTAYEYKTGKSIGGTITIGDGEALLYKTDENSQGYLMKDVIKVDQDKGLIIGLNPDEKKIVLMVKTNSCPLSQ